MFDTSPPMSTEELYDTLANERRRACVAHLERGTDWVPVKDLARDIADATGDGTDDAVESAYISLIQIHLPKLDGYGVIEYDDDEKLIRRGPNFRYVDSCLRRHGLDRSGFDLVDVTRVGAFLTALALLAGLLFTGYLPALAGLAVFLNVGVIAVSVWSAN